MKEMLTRNLGFKISSLIIAFLIWLIIINIEDPAIVGNFEDIPVTIINEDVLGSMDKVYDVLSGEVVDVQVKGKRSIIENLSRAEFIATADLKELSIVNAVEIKISVPKYEGEVEIVGQSVTTMEISLEDLVTEQFRVDIVERGTVREGYYINEKTASPNIVQVKGAQSVISKIKEIVVDVNVNMADETFTITATPQVYDHNGTLMDSDKMSFSHEEFEIKVNVLETKTVKLRLELEGDPAPGYGYVAFKYEPKEVEIAGTKEALDKVPHIMGTYNINYARKDIEDEIDINDFIDQDVILIDDNQNAVVNIDIEPLETKNVTFPSNKIRIINIPEDKEVDFQDQAPITVKASGLTDEIGKLNPNNINPYIDLKDFEGDFGEVEILFDSDQMNIKFERVSTFISLNDLE